MPTLSRCNVVLLGPPGAGRSVQAAKVASRFGIIKFNVGDILREEIKAATDLGQQAKSYVDKGELVPDEVVMPIVQRKLARPEVIKNGWLLDGFPRTSGQAAMLNKYSLMPNVVALLEAPDEVCIARIEGKPDDEKNFDDKGDALVSRIKMYHDNIGEFVKMLKPLLVKIDANRPIDEVWADLEKTLAEKVEMSDSVHDLELAVPM